MVRSERFGKLVGAPAMAKRIGAISLRSLNAPHGLRYVTLPYEKPLADHS